MPVTILFRQERLEIEGPLTLGAALAALGIPPELYLALREGLLVSVEETLYPGDTVRLVGVISGG